MCRKKQAVFSQVEQTLQAVRLPVEIGHRYDAEPGVTPRNCDWVKIKVLQLHTTQHIMHAHLQALKASTPCVQGHDSQVSMTPNITNASARELHAESKHVLTGKHKMLGGDPTSSQGGR